MAISLADELRPVQDVTARLQALLDLASDVKPERTIEPPLPRSEFIDQVNALHDDFDDNYDQAYKFATIETAAREIFYSLITSVDILEPAFVGVWNLLDVLILCGDQGKCDPVLVCWLIEELLDSLTTDGCRVAFVYLESRRERLVQKNFDKKTAPFLRFCNELLRRLSRAEDAILCGRIFFLLFLTFPLGDKSSVNLRGEYHVENTTKFEVVESQPEQNGDKMEVDLEPVKAETSTPKAGTPQPPSRPGGKAVPIKAPHKKVEEEVMSNSELYPIFWRLQKDFSNPERLFAPEHFQAFKKGLTNTISKFKTTPTVVQTKAAEDGKRGTKRKLGDDGSVSMHDEMDNSDHFVDNYNPKYLTSRDLFDLELSDLAFQRHILVQALILMDFLLSLTEKAKKRIAQVGTKNGAMVKDFTLSEEDTKWVVATRQTVTNYLSGTQEGKLFNRMVETVLARDKNWIRWKHEGCPAIVRNPVPAESELVARKGARDATKVRRVPEKPAGSMDLSFLGEGSGGGLEALKDPERHTAPSIDQLIDGISTDELDLEMATEDEAMNLQNAIANKRWRILRQARATRLGLLDKVEPGKDLGPVFRPPLEPEVANEAAIEHVDSATPIVATDTDLVADENLANIGPANAEMESVAEQAGTPIPDADAVVA